MRSMAFSKVGRVSDLQNLKPLGAPSASGEVYYHCPYCQEVRGKPDRDGKLAFNVKKQVGYCFKCCTPVHGESVQTEGLAEIARLYKVNVPKKKLEMKAEVYDLSWTSAIPDMPEVAAYCASRGIGDDIVQKFRLRACSIPMTGLVIPNRDLGSCKTDYFQIRNIANTGMRYTNPKGSRKALFGVDTMSGASAAVVCEGAISAMIASQIETGLGAIALLGKSLSDELASEHAKFFTMEKVTVLLDGGEYLASLDVADKLLKHTGCDVRIGFLPYKKDPNEISLEVLRDCHARSVRYSLATDAFLKRAILHRPDSEWGWDRLMRLVRSNSADGCFAFGG